MNAFNQAQSIFESKGDISPELKKEIRQQLELLQEELGREDPDVGKIQKLWKWLKAEFKLDCSNTLQYCSGRN